MTYQPPTLEEVGSVRDLTLFLKNSGKSDFLGWGSWGDHGPNPGS